MQCIVDEQKRKRRRASGSKHPWMLWPVQRHTKVTYMDCSAARFRALRQWFWKNAMCSLHVSSVDKVAGTLKTIDSTCQATLSKETLLPQHKNLVRTFLQNCIHKTKCPTWLRTSLNPPSQGSVRRPVSQTDHARMKTSASNPRFATALASLGRTIHLLACQMSY